jgi:phage terminase small subunit
MSDSFDPSIPLPNAKHERFAQEWAKNPQNQSECARNAGYSEKSARFRACALATNANIKARRDWLATKAAEGFVMDRRQWLESLSRIAEKAEAANDFAAAKGCLAEIGKACPGFYAPVETDGKLEITIVQAPVEA